VVDAQGEIFVKRRNLRHQQCEPLLVVGEAAEDRNRLEGDPENEVGLANGQCVDAHCGMALDREGHLIITYAGKNCIRKVTTAEGRVMTVAESGEDGPLFADGTVPAAHFHGLSAITVDGSNCFCIFADGEGTNAQFNCLQGIAVDSAGNVPTPTATPCARSPCAAAPSQPSQATGRRATQTGQVQLHTITNHRALLLTYRAPFSFPSPTVITTACGRTRGGGLDAGRQPTGRGGFRTPQWDWRWTLRSTSYDCQLADYGKVTTAKGQVRGR